MLTVRRSENNLAKHLKSIHNVRMSFHRIRSKTTVNKPQRAPAKSATTGLPPTLVEKTCDDHDFPSFYAEAEQHYPTDALNRPRTEAASSPAPLAASMVRLIELVGAEMGCTHEEIESIKTKALKIPTIIEYCQEIFDQKIRPRLETTDPFEAHDEDQHCLFLLEGRFGETMLRMPMTLAIEPYHHQRLEIYAVEKSPWAKKGLPTPKKT